jgi:hypothetical protein
MRESTRRIGLHFRVGELPSRAELRGQWGRRAAAHHVQDAPTAIEHAARPRRTHRGEGRRRDTQFSAARTVQRSVEHRAVVLILTQADGCLAREPQRRGRPQSVEPARARRGGRGAERRRGARAMKTRGVMGGAERRRHPRGDFVASEQRRDERASRSVRGFRSGERCGDDRASGMRGTGFMRIVESVDARVQCIDKRGLRCRQPHRQTDYRGLRLPAPALYYAGHLARLRIAQASAAHPDGVEQMVFHLRDQIGLDRVELQ